MTRSIVLGGILVLGLHPWQTAWAVSIGVNFTATNFGGGPYPILPSETAGLVPQQNWNNTSALANGLTSDVASPVSGAVVDSTGAVTSANVVWLNANSQVNSSGGNTTPNERLYRGTIEGLGNGSPPLEVAMFDVPYARYNVIAYLAGFSFSAEASVKLGSEQYYYIQSSNFTTDGFIKATATSKATETLATYAEFDNVTGNSFTLQIFTTGGNRGSIAGFEVVKVPEPGTCGLAAIGGAIGLAALRRKRCAMR